MVVADTLTLSSHLALCVRIASLTYVVLPGKNEKVYKVSCPFINSYTVLSVYMYFKKKKKHCVSNAKCLL